MVKAGIEEREIVERSAPGRGGRPPSSRAGEVERRILDAASHLFLARGFEGTSCDQVAVLARAGKASIYARYANKEALFAAVIRRDVGRGLAVTGHIPPELPLHDRLIAVGTSIVEHSLRPQVIVLIRLLIAEAVRFPELVSRADAIGREGSIKRVAEVIACRSVPAGAVERATVPAARFIELVSLPLQMRALLGDDLAALTASAAERIGLAADVLAATGLLDGWS